MQPGYFTYRCVSHGRLDCRDGECLSVQERIALREAADTIEDLLRQPTSVAREFAQKQLAKIRYLLEAGTKAA